MTNRFNPGDVIILNFIGAVNAKRRPGIIVSSNLYQQNRPDVIVGIRTSNLATAITPLDYILQDWAAAGLHQPSAFRAYFSTELSTGLTHIGKLSDRDWQEVQLRLNLALATT